jgi:hypothetical protein
MCPSTARRSLLGRFPGPVRAVAAGLCRQVGYAAAHRPLPHTFWPYGWRGNSSALGTRVAAIRFSAGANTASEYSRIPGLRRLV